MLCSHRSIYPMSKEEKDTTEAVNNVEGMADWLINYIIRRDIYVANGSGCAGHSNQEEMMK